MPQPKALKPIRARMAAPMIKAAARTTYGAYLGSWPLVRAERLRTGREGGGHSQLAPENSLCRLMIQRAIMFTTRVMTNRTRPAAISVLTLQAAGLGEVQRDFSGDGLVAGLDQAGGEGAGGEHQGHGHGFAEGAAQAEHDGADDARAGERAAPPS